MKHIISCQCCALTPYACCSWFQLYWPQINDLTASILSRVEAAGFDVLLLTLDTMHLGWRPKDLSEAFLPMVHGYSSAVRWAPVHNISELRR